jgi:5-methylcytosine-specific restriction endonuclease McrA
MHVFVVDAERKPLAPCHPAVARRLLGRGKASVFKEFPFTIILREKRESPAPYLRLKVAPGSRVTGLALVQEAKETTIVLWAAELRHRGLRIKARLEERRRLRRARRGRKTRYREPRFLNRKRDELWIPPSMESRVGNVLTWVNRICTYAPLNALSMELHRFDPERLRNPEIDCVEYRAGDPFGYEVREYLLEKWRRQCVYCGKKGVPLQIEHVTPKKRGGTDRVTNLALSCASCNRKKGDLTAAEFGFPHVWKTAHESPAIGTPLDLARWRILGRIKSSGFNPEAATGGRTKYNRARLNLPKSKWIEAACVGTSTREKLVFPEGPILRASAMGHGKRQRCRTDGYGFPVQHAPRAKKFLGFQTGDIVRARIPRGKHLGVHVGRVAIRFRRMFRLNGFDVHPRYLTRIHRADGYDYGRVETARSMSEH